ncbi:MAG: DUF1572 family protein [Flavobacteriaceae bacterium]|nr:DUF1572 family protein [Flavobacteriaceae bacterium]
MNDSWITEFKNDAIFRLRESNRMNLKSLEHISEKELWLRPNSKANSIANLLLHLCGNIRQYAISSLGGTKDIRERDSEFSTTEGFEKTELITQLFDTVEEAIETIENASEEQLLRKRNAQGFNLSGIGIVMHVVEHYSYHTGQIAFWVKQLKEIDLGFYDSSQLNIQNED